MPMQMPNTHHIEKHQALLDQHVQWILGPLLSKNTEALAPVLQDELPVISLSMDNTIAGSSPALFIHNLAPETQARFMADYAFAQGIRRIAIIQNSSHAAERESLALTEHFHELGGDIADIVDLNEHSIDNRAILRQLREDTDDQILLHQLIQRRALLIPEQKLDIDLPVHLDALYLAMTGKQVSELAGQLVYMDIRGIPLLGSSLWQDGHILDDKGRNLSNARFIQHNTQAQHSDLYNRFRQVWGNDTPGKLFTIAYDSAQIGLLLSSKLGLSGSHMIQALHANEGFPGESGQVHFNADGLGEKTFTLYHIQHHQIVPVQ